MPAAPNLNVAFEPVKIDIRIGDRCMAVPAVPASVWIPLLAGADTDTLDIFPGLLDEEDQVTVDSILFAGEIGADQFKQIVYDLITEASGHPWWWTLNLLSILRGPNATQFLGETATIDASRVSLGCWVNHLYAVLVRHQKLEDKVRIDAELDMPPPGVELEISEADQKATEATFFSMMRNS